MFNIILLLFPFHHETPDREVYKTHFKLVHTSQLFSLLQVKELNHVLEAEKSCRTDLEMYVAVLNTQKSVLQEDAEKLRKELHDGTTLHFL